jgi:predicted DNA-binding transcriptional regulator AlpA
MSSLIKDELVPDPQVQKEFGITAMTLWRWDHDRELDFPPPVKIRKKNYRSRQLLEKFKQRVIAEAIAARADDR